MEQSIVDICATLIRYICEAHIEAKGYIKDSARKIYIDGRLCRPYRRRVSQKATAAAAATFRLSTMWLMGIFTV